MDRFAEIRDALAKEHDELAGTVTLLASPAVAKRRLDEAMHGSTSNPATAGAEAAIAALGPIISQALNSLLRTQELVAEVLTELASGNR